jgi:arylsulfatase A-like enzyme
VKAGIANQTTFIICADHGFSGAEYQLNVAAYVTEAGLQDKIRLYPTGSGMFVRQLPSFVPAQDQPRLQKMFARLREDPHIIHIYDSNEFPKLGLPRFEDSSRLRGQFMILSDIDTYLAASPNGSTSLKHLEHPAYGHGSLPQYGRMYPMLVLSGSGVKHGTRIGHVHNVDVAPTVCRLLGLPAMPVEGHVLEEALSDTATRP